MMLKGYFNSEKSKTDYFQKLKEKKREKEKEKRKEKNTDFIRIQDKQSHNHKSNLSLI